METDNTNNTTDGVHSQDYYELENGKHASDYIAAYKLGFFYGNALKYCVRASRKPDNSAESDLNKALTYITSSHNEYSSLRRFLLHVFNKIKFNNTFQLTNKNLENILVSIICFEHKDKIAALLVDYMKLHNITVHNEFKRYIRELQ